MSDEPSGRARWSTWSSEGVDHRFAIFVDRRSGVSRFLPFRGSPFRDFCRFGGVGGIEKGCRHHVVTMSSHMSSPVFSLQINNL